MMTDDVYYRWLCESVSNAPRSEHESYSKLLKRLFDREFVISFSRDIDRLNDGLQLRSIFAAEAGITREELNSTLEYCRILEVMIALARRCETSIMFNNEVGDRTGQWFWGMISSLGLGRMNNIDFNVDYVDGCIDAFLHRHYKPNGEGGLFTVMSATNDMTKISIWRQMNLYLNELLIDEGVIERRFI